MIVSFINYRDHCIMGRLYFLQFYKYLFGWSSGYWILSNRIQFKRELSLVDKLFTIIFRACYSDSKKKLADNIFSPFNKNVNYIWKKCNRI